LPPPKPPDRFTGDRTGAGGGPAGAIGEPRGAVLSGDAQAVGSGVVPGTGADASGGRIGSVIRLVIKGRRGMVGGVQHDAPGFSVGG